MKRFMITLVLFMALMVPVMASEEETAQPIYEPGTEESGGTIFGTLSGTAPKDPDTPVEPDTPSDPSTPTDPTKPNQGGTTGGNTGSDTGDNTTFFWWIFLFVGAYCILRQYQNKESK